MTGALAWRSPPVFVCRRVHPTTAWMARRMGFHVIETKTQYVHPVVLEKDDVAQRKYDEVVEELGFKLTPHEGAVPPMVQQFSTILPERIDDAAERWGLVSDHPGCLICLRSSATTRSRYLTATPVLWSWERPCRRQPTSPLDGSRPTMQG
jgi:hypothetical protein